MPTPGSYYDMLPERLRAASASARSTRTSRSCASSRSSSTATAGHAYLLQIFLKESAGLYGDPTAGPFFYEIIQRKGDQRLRRRQLPRAVREHRARPGRPAPADEVAGALTGGRRASASVDAYDRGGRLGLGYTPAMDQLLSLVPGATPSCEEGELVLAARGGDRAAFGELYERYGRMVHGVLLCRVPRGQVEDLVQDVFLNALRRSRLAARPGALRRVARGHGAQPRHRLPPARAGGTVELTDETWPARSRTTRPKRSRCWRRCARCPRPTARRWCCGCSRG